VFDQRGCTVLRQWVVRVALHRAEKREEIHGKREAPPAAGEAAPAFTLPAANREGAVSLADLRGDRF
jgi:hypothetical protein